MRRWWRDLTDLVLPSECGGCGRPRTVLCPRCRTALSGAGPCRVRPDPEPPGLPVVHAAARYADQVRAALLAHKERGALALAAPLGVALAGAVRAGLAADGGTGARTGGGAVLLVPVPSARGAVRARGHDPARRIALTAAAELRRTGTPARVLAALRQRRAVADQSGLNSRQRQDNLAGALVVVPHARLLLGEGQVVLVDDLMTTGASLAEAARAVRLTGSASVAEAVCGVDGRERTGEVGTRVTVEAAVRRYGVPVEAAQAGRIRAGDGLRAAVVAASPDAFEINRN
ncbi:MULTISPECIES: ComF family protein [Streptomyces]|uniref:ComF family protein n=1 Tax=Streptomyces fuscus TaxID=3048495 RepID=A0ABT7JB38_9ACTN|nr:MULTISPECIES: ComF family protein [Streptomyces]MCM1972713.1 ComF family protein [Streptomyces sp. G1]MDL2082081.1 ComF family protein [Streptomyces fuscus]